jgi:methyl-accepting chemotaxis protein
MYGNGRRSLTITEKFIAGILIALLAVFAAMGGALSLHEKKVLVAELGKKGENLTKFLAGISAEPIMSYNFSYLENYMRDVAAGDTDIVFAVVQDKDGNPLTHGKSGSPGKENILEFSSPVRQGNETIGTVRIGFTTAHIDSALRSSQLILLVLSVGALLLAAFIVYTLFRILAIKPIHELNATVERVAQGDLSQTVVVDTKDEIGSLFLAVKGMVERLKGVIADVKATADNVAAGSLQISAGTEQVSQGASEQAASAEETSSSVEEMNTTIRQNADNALQTEKIALKSAGDAAESGTAVSEAVAAMKEIASKISVIEEIARQTNLLALNAAIEAARAGEHGKGFAVVAAEVRKLAERSQTAAQDISRLSASSVETAERAGGMILKLVPDIQKTAELVQEISASSKEQAAGAEQISGAIQQLNKVTQRNAGAAEEIAMTASELASQAEHLLESILFFKVNGEIAALPVKRATRGPAAPVIKPAGVRLRLGHEAHDRKNDKDDEFEKF